MSYQTYITEALVCGSWHSNTADKSILLFAREAGMVYTQAKSVRKEESKQRYALQDASHVRVTLIRGRVGWKVASAEPLNNFYSLTTHRISRALVRDTVLLLRRVMHGEVAHPQIFDDVIQVFSHVEAHEHIVMRTILFTRILFALGYIAPTILHEQFLNGQFPFSQLNTISKGAIADLQGLIDNALTQSQL